MVLIRPADGLMFTEAISISNTGAMVKPGFDRVTVFGSPGSQTYVIDRIYKLKDREQAKSIKAQLTGK